MDENLASYKQLFVTTSKQYIASLLQNIATLGTNPTESESINQAYISAHSLKSQSLVMGFTQTGILSGTLEQVFKKGKEGEIVLSSESISVIKQAADQLATSLTTIEQQNHESNLGTTITALEQQFGVKLIH